MPNTTQNAEGHILLDITLKDGVVKVWIEALNYEEGGSSLAGKDIYLTISTDDAKAQPFLALLKQPLGASLLPGTAAPYPGKAPDGSNYRGAPPTVPEGDNPELTHVWRKS